MKALVWLALFGFGCTGRGALLRPDGRPGPEACPEEAKKAMRILRLYPGTAAWVEIDVTQFGEEPIIVFDGPVESLLHERMGWLDSTSRLYGRIWTAGSHVVIRYYSAQPPDGDPIPICAIARLDYGGLKKKPGRYPGSAELASSRASVHIVNEFP